jgi:hypothetical protein
MRLGQQPQDNLAGGGEQSADYNAQSGALDCAPNQNAPRHSPQIS